MDIDKPNSHVVDFQDDVYFWIKECGGDSLVHDARNRHWRFVEESIELAQACQVPKEDVLALVDYVYNKPPGEVYQEIGGVFVTLLALCNAENEELAECGNIELKRVWANIDKIRAKMAARSGYHGPLPVKPTE